MNNTILASQGMMQRSSMPPDVIMARRVMDEKSWRIISGRKNRVCGRMYRNIDFQNAFVGKIEYMESIIAKLRVIEKEIDEGL